MLKRSFLTILLTASSAFGGIISGTYSGVISQFYANQDTYGYFGSPGAPLIGKAITVGFSYDPSACGFNSTPTAADLYPCAAESVSGFVTVDGITFSSTNTDTGGGYGQVSTNSAGGQFSMLAFDTDHIVNIILYSTGPYSPEAVLSGPPTSINYEGDFQVNFGAGGYGFQDIIHFTNVQSVNAEAPEPSTFLLFGSVSVAAFVHRRKRTA